MTCIFCLILARKLPGKILYEDQDLAVIKDVNPEAPVHLLIIPKRHFDSVNSLDEKNSQIGGKMLLAAKKMAEAQGIQSGYKILINTGREVGQEILHLHMHLLGGWGRKPFKR
jgi:histidine triad (HIT) family protein